MKLHWIDLALASALVAASLAIAGLALLRKLRQTVAGHKHEVAELQESVQALESRLVQLSSNAELQPEPAASALEPAQPKKESISSEIQAVLTAAAVALFGKKSACARLACSLRRPVSANGHSRAVSSFRPPTTPAPEDESASEVERERNL